MPTHAASHVSFGLFDCSRSAAEFTSAFPLWVASQSAVATAASSATTASGRISYSANKPVIASSGNAVFSPARSVCSATTLRLCASAAAARFLATHAVCDSGARPSSRWYRRFIRYLLEGSTVPLGGGGAARQQRHREHEGSSDTHAVVSTQHGQCRRHARRPHKAYHAPLEHGSPDRCYR